VRGSHGPKSVDPLLQIPKTSLLRVFCRKGIIFSFSVAILAQAVSARGESQEELLQA
jgi:hypothetical protein